MEKNDKLIFLGENMPSSSLENFTDEQISQVSQSDEMAESEFDLTSLLSAVRVARGSY